LLSHLISSRQGAPRQDTVIFHGIVRTVAVVTEMRLAVFLGGRAWVANLVAVQCLQGRVRPLLKCPRAHEGNFQSLYYRNGELACRHCHDLRYRSNIAATEIDRARLKRMKLLTLLGGEPGSLVPPRRGGASRKLYGKLVCSYSILTSLHYDDLKTTVHKRVQVD